MRNHWCLVYQILPGKPNQVAHGLKNMMLIPLNLEQVTFLGMPKKYSSETCPSFHLKENISRINDSPCDLPTFFVQTPLASTVKNRSQNRAKFSNTAFRKMMDVSKDLVGRGFGDFTISKTR